MDNLCNFNVGEVVTKLIKCTPFSLDKECILYVTSMGSIGAFVPFEHWEDVSFFTLLEMYLWIEILPLCGRDHASFWS